LQNNGGPTETIALQATSPAVAAVPLAYCNIMTDQRGASRPAPGSTACDIGAYEYGSMVTSPSQITSMTSTVIANDSLPLMPDSIFNCFSQAQFVLSGNGVITPVYWPTACFFSVLGYAPNMDSTYVYNWEQSFVLSQEPPAVADDYLASGWDAHCANCFPQYSQTANYTYVYVPPKPTATATPAPTAAPTPAPIGGATCSGVTCGTIYGQQAACYMVNGAPECCSNGLCLPTTPISPTPAPTGKPTAIPTATPSTVTYQVTCPSTVVLTLPAGCTQ